MSLPPSARRQRSRKQLLDVLTNHPEGVARVYLSSTTGLSRSAVAEGVQDLLAAELVVEQPGDVRSPRGPRGRPSTLLVPVTARRQLNDLPDDLWTRISIEFYKDAADAVFKALVE